MVHRMLRSIESVAALRLTRPRQLRGQIHARPPTLLALQAAKRSDATLFRIGSGAHAAGIASANLPQDTLRLA